MGNTKMVYFDGEVADREKLPSREELIRLTHASYLSMGVTPGSYMASNDEAKSAFVIGALESSSLRGTVEPLLKALRFESGTIIRCDQDWTGIWVLDIFDGKIREQRLYVPSDEQQQQPRPTTDLPTKEGWYELIQGPLKRVVEVVYHPGAESLVYGIDGDSIARPRVTAAKGATWRWLAELSGR